MGKIDKQNERKKLNNHKIYVYTKKWKKNIKKILYKIIKQLYCNLVSNQIRFLFPALLEILLRLFYLSISYI